MTQKTTLLETIMTRRSVRDFKEGNVSQQDLQTILQAAIMAPSAGNGQPWKFHVITGKTKQAFAQTLRNSKTVPEPWRAPLLTIVNTVPVMIAIENPIITAQGLSAFKAHFNLENAQLAAVGSLLGTAASIQNMLLAIHSLGYGSVWIGHPSVLEAAKKAAGIRGELCGFLPVGHPADKQNDYVNRTRKPVEQVIKFYE